MAILRIPGVRNKGLRYKLFVAFALMSVIPVLACLYLISIYAFPHMGNLINVYAVIAISVFIAALGFILARRLVDPIINMALEAKMIASGQYDNRIAIASDDEIGNLGQSINSITLKIKTNMEELKGYGARMGEINIDIHKKVMALSSLLQIGDMLSAGSTQLDSLLGLAVEKAAMVFEEGYGILFLPKGEGPDLYAKIVYNNTACEKLARLVIRRAGRGVLERAAEEKKVLILDKSVRPSKEMEGFMQAYDAKNLIVIPVYTTAGFMGLLVIGNRTGDFRFRNDDVELVKVFAKQITIAIENDILTRKAEEFAIKDDLTGLYNKNFILARLEEEIRRAVFYQRPCSFIVLGIDEFRNFRDTKGELAAEEVLKKTAKVIKDSTSPVGKAARISGDEFAMLLPEKNKKEAGEIADDIRRKVESASLLREGKADLTMSGGVGENPIDGATAEEVFRRALAAVKEARLKGGSTVVV
jgi:diguanylate cyclase (GGDEF)-like protein